MPESLAEFFLENLQAHRHETAYRQRRGYRSQTFTYGDTLEMAFGFARELEQRGIAKDDRVMIWGENCAEWVAGFVGCVLSGVGIVPMDDGASADFAPRVFRQVDAKLLLASQRHAQEFAGAGQTAPSLILEDLRHSARADAPRGVTLRPDDTLQIVFTSGTTAEPRGVVITHGNVMANIAPLEREIGRYLKYERFVHPLRFLNLLPLSHVFGQFLGMFLPPLLGGTVVFQNELKPSEVIETIRRERVSVLVSVPRVLQSLKQKVEREKEDRGETQAFQEQFAAAKKKHFLRRWWVFRGIRKQFGWKFLAFISGGAALDGETEDFWHRLGYAVIQGYGLTETTSLVSVNHPFRLGRGSIGKVLPGREVKLAADGEILVRGGGVASGYWDDRGAQHILSDAPSPASDEQGWYRTGDIGALDAAGNLYFKGRKKEVIVTPGGMNVYPEDLEAALRRQPEVKDCVVVGMDRGGNAEACAVLILRGGSDAAEVVARANEGLAEYQRMRIWVEWPEEDFPRTNTQKPRRNLIREAAEERVQKSPLLTQSTRETWGTRAQEDAGSRDNSPLAELIARVSGRRAELSEDTKLDSDLGLSSLDRVELMGALEDRYQVDLSETRFSALRTVGDLEKMLRGEAPPGAAYHYPRWVLGWPLMWVRFLTHYLLLRPAILLLGWPRIAGREHLRGVRGPLLVVSNHIGDVDPGFILTALPARFRHRLAIATGGEALEALRTPAADRNFLLGIYDRIQWILGVSLLNLFPLPREAGFRRSFAYAGEAVDRGYSVLVFPEGRHTTDGKLLPFRAGIGLLAENLGIPVLPMRIDGLFEVKQSGRKFAAPWKIGVKIGELMKFEAGSDPAEFAAELQRAVDEL
ncbi:MAG TPA: AMP-binding protein [Terriglobales bacterium]|nr:AMP-binding protein [Terriglobales bacterium]